jgi:hypothetical protein
VANKNPSSTLSSPFFSKQLQTLHQIQTQNYTSSVFQWTTENPFFGVVYAVEELVEDSNKDKIDDGKTKMLDLSVME